MPTAKLEPEPRFSARVKVRPKAQLTLPEEIRRALQRLNCQDYYSR
jgi:hypothetical protein